MNGLFFGNVRNYDVALKKDLLSTRVSSGQLIHFCCMSRYVIVENSVGTERRMIICNRNTSDLNYFTVAFQACRLQVDGKIGEHAVCFNCLKLP